MQAQLTAILTHILNSAISLHDIEPDTSLASLGLTSLDHVRFYVELEKSFQVQFSDEMFADGSLLTVGGILQSLELLGAMQ